MKKVCVELKPRVKEWKFVIYESPDAAYYMRMSREKIEDFDGTYSHTFSLKKQEIAVIEWLGSEYIYDDEHTAKLGQPKSLSHEAYECIRLIKFPAEDKDKITDMSPYVYVEAHYGWIPKGTLGWSQNDLNKKIIISPRLPKIDLSKIFKDPNEKEEGDKSYPPQMVS